MSGNAVELATAYISLLPEGSKIAPFLSKLEQQLEAAGKAGGQKYSDAMSAAFGKSAGATDKAHASTVALTTANDKAAASAKNIGTANDTVTAALGKTATAADKAKTSTQNLATAHDKATTSAKNAGTASQTASGQVAALGTSADAAQGGLSRMQAVASTGAGLAALGGLAAGLVTSLLSVGDTFANVSKTLQVTTGASGVALEGMKESVDNIAKSSPKSFGEISQTLATLAQRTNLTGAPLETLTKQVLKLNGFGGQFTTDINGATAAMAAFGVKGSDMGPVLDQLFKVSQSTGVSMDTLTAAAVKGAPQFQQFGLNLAETAGLMGSLDKAGVSSDVVMTGLNKAMNNFANAGKDPKQALGETIKSIHDLTESGKDAQALDLANNIFGAKGAGAFVNAVKSGAISVDGLSAALDTQKGGILDQAGAIPTMSAAWAVFKNNIMIDLEPLATKVFGAFTKGITWLKEHGVPIIQSFGEWMSKNGDTLKMVASVLGPVAVAIGVITVATKAWSAAVGVLNVVMNANPISLIIIAIVALVAGLVLAYQHSEKFRTIVQTAWAAIKAAVSAAWNDVIKPAFAWIKNFIVNDLIPVVMNLWHNVIEPAFKAIGAAISFWWNNIVKPYFSAMKTLIMDVIVPAVMWLWHNALEPAFSAIGTVISLWWNNIAKPVFEAWKTIIMDVIVPAVMWLWHNVIEPGFEAIGSKISMVWNSVIKPTFDFFKTAFSEVGDKATWLWHTIFEPVFEGIKTAVSAAWDFISPLFDKIGTGIHAIGEIGSAIGGTLKSAFDGVVDILKAPLHLLGKFLSAIPGSVLGYDIPGFSSVHDWGESLQGLASGGPVVGPGTGTSDSVLIKASNGEFIEPAAMVTAETLPWLEAIRAGWVPPAGLLHAMVPGFAGGGLVTDDEVARMGGGTVNLSLLKALRSKFPNVKLDSAKTDHVVDGGYHPKGDAIDVDPDPAVLDYLWSNREKLVQIIFDDPNKVWYNVHGEHAEGAAARAIYGADTMAQHRDHIHLAATSAWSGMDDGSTASAAMSKPAATEEDRVADAIIAEGRKRGISEKGIKIALAVGLAESGLKNLDHGPDTSIGAFQQQDSWGTKEQRMDPSYAAGKFYDSLAKTDYNNMDPAAAAQAVQRSAFSDGSNYSAQMSKADDIYAQRSNITISSNSSSNSSGTAQNVFVTNWPGSNSSTSSPSSSSVDSTSVAPDNSSSITPQNSQSTLATFGDKAATAGQNFLTANADQFVSDLGLPNGKSGFLGALTTEVPKYAQQLASWRPPVQINNHITVSDEKSQVRKLQEQNQLALMQYGGGA